ncbi:hypothetical protein BDW22DRAFT_415844 [Trametopsis cervina]|nr:hypothetical protein BDW22DRAFT_415844 [Trametopsis cervina]
MVDWRSPEVEKICFSLYTKAVVFVLGAFSWYFFQTWHVVEGALITRRLKMTYTHIPYLVARYGQLTTLILISVLTRLPAPIVSSCKAIDLPRSTTVVGNLTLVAASANLSVRAFTIWKDNLIVKAVLVLSSTGHFIYAVLMGVLSVRAVWQAHHTVCVLLTLSFQRLRRHNFVQSEHPLLTRLMNQGVGYAVITWLTTIPMTVSIVLDLNEAMNIFLSAPGCTISVVASSAAVISLLRSKHDDPEACRRSRDTGAADTTMQEFTTGIDT